MPTSRSAGCGGSAARCSAASPPTASCESPSCAPSIRASWRGATARIGRRLAQLAQGDDERRVDPAGPARSISAETTFARDEADAEALARNLWPLCEKVALRLKQNALAGGTVTLKLKTADFRLRTRSRRLADPTQLADTLYRTARHLLAGEADGTTRFRLIGVGADGLVDSAAADLPTLFDRPRHLEKAIDDIRRRHGAGVLRRGHGLPDA